MMVVVLSLYKLDLLTNGKDCKQKIGSFGGLQWVKTQKLP